MGIAQAVEKARTKLNTASSKFLVDKCDILGVTLVNDGYGNTTQTQATLASNIPCNYSVLSSYDRTEAAAIASGLSHKLIMGFSNATRAIIPSNKIKVLARSPNAELVFEQPTFLRDSRAGMVEIAATVQVA